MRFVIVLALAGMATAQGQDTPQTVYERGHRYWNLSFAAFNTLEKQAPDSGYSFALLGEARAEKRQYTAALEAFTKAANELPGLRGVHASIAEIQLAEGNVAAASESRALEQQLGTPNCATEKLWCDFATGKFETVIRAADALPAPERFYWLAKAYRQLAVQAFADLDRFTESAELDEVKAKLLRDEHRYTDAVRELRAALALKPGDPELQRELAASLFLTEDYKGVLPELEELQKAQPKSANLNFFVGDAMLETQRVDEAVPYLEAALRLDPTLTPAHVALGMCYFHQGEEQKALPHLKAGLALDQDGRIHYLLARAYQKMGQPELAKEMMTEYRQIQTARTDK